MVAAFRPVRPCLWLLCAGLIALAGCSTGGDDGAKDGAKDAGPVTDAIGDGGAGSCQGQTGCTCSVDADCADKKCGEVGGQKVCLGKDLTLCAPCKDDASCQAGGDNTAACVDGGNDGAFCAPGCAEDADCATGYTCKDAADLAGKTAKRCVLATGACGCSAWAVSSKASTVCHAEKDGAKCTGERVCGADGKLGACSTSGPQKEVCNGLDDDCDGATDGAATCDDGVKCTTDSCDGAAGCQHKADDASCDDGNPCTDTACDLATGCTSTELTGKCEDASLCTSEETCKDGACVPGKQKTCADNDPCTTDACDASSGNCVFKTIADCGEPPAKSCKGNCGGSSPDSSCYCDSVCSEYGDCCKDFDKFCGNPTCSSDQECDDKNKCTVNTCDPNSKKCKSEPATDGTDCGTGNKCVIQECKSGSCTTDFKSCDDGDDCTTDNCMPTDGSCKTSLKPAGSPCNDGNPCSTPDKCDDAGSCVGETAKDDTSCSDGQTCTSGDKCVGGQCVGSPDSTKCDDLNPCTTDACVAVKGCVFTPTKDGTMCQDGDKCTVSDVCQAGACVGLPKCTVVHEEPFNCEPKTTWTFTTTAPSGKTAWAVDATPDPPGFYSPKCSLNYNDGKAYPGDTSGTATSPKFKLPAQGPLKLTFRDYQDMESGSNYDQRFVEISPDGFTQEILKLQLANDVKTAKTWVLRTVVLDKWLGQEVQVRYLFDSGDGINNETAGWFVDDLRVVVDKLPDNLTCKVQHDCPYDGDPCTAMVCTDGKCTAGTSNSPCEDGDLCTESDACKDGKCLGGGKTNCDDANVCTDDSCDPKTGCKHAANKATCDDGDPCTSPETCLGGACIAAPKSCHDSNACTKDWCDAQSGSCKHDTLPGCKLEAATLPYGTQFDCADPDNKFWDTDSAPTGPRWAIDATPLPPGYKSSKCSLNFNDGQGVGCVGGKQKTAAVGVEGWVYSPFFDTSAVAKNAPLTALFHLGGSWLSSSQHLKVQASSDNGKTWTDVVELKGTTSTAFVPTLLDLSAWAGKFIQLRFHFATANCSAPNYTGPFIDDFKIFDATCKVDTDCDDGNSCTEATCDAGTGKCSFAAKKSGSACDDGNACTSEDICGSNGCAGAVQKSCDDGNSCTVDACDPEAGACENVELAKGTTCTDGEGCTDNDKCEDGGKCAGTPSPAGKACSDGALCTEKDACDGKGSCQGTPLAAGKGTCSDGNDCTEKDACDGKGQCAGQPKKEGSFCSDTDPCTADACDAAGACQGKPDIAKCDDKDPCTLDTCVKTSATGSTCKHAPVSDGGTCDDGDACTDNDTCSAGKCAGKGQCTFSTLLEDDMKCGSTGWTLDPVVAADKVGWQIDGTPNPPGYKSEKCSLNYNNGKDYAGISKGTATSAAIALPGGVVDIVLSLWSYQDVESGQNYDKRFVEISDDDFAKNVQSVQLSNAENKAKWAQFKVSLLPWAGKTVKVRVRFDSVDDVSNATAGWFVDDLLIQAGKK